jgi:hypothetical protein
MLEVYSRNLFGLVPTDQVAELILYGSGVNKIGSYEIPGTSVTDTIETLQNNWIDIEATVSIK